MVWSALQNARSANLDLANIWLDIANAYGSIPHKLMIFALKRYGVPDKWISLISNYYAGLWSRCFSPSSPSGWHHHLKGIFTGCTLSIILFLVGMNIIIEFVSLSKAPPVVSPSTHPLPLIRAFMDDVNLMSSTIQGTQDLLSRCLTALKWAGMSFRADKSRSIIIKKGRSMNSTPFSSSESSNPSDFSGYIPSIHAMPIKFLGRVINGSLSDRNSVQELKDKLSEGLKIIHCSPHSPSQKLWILQHLLLPRIQWPLMIYEISSSVALSLEQTVSKFIRTWLKLPKMMSSIALYSKHSPCPLPIKSISSIFKAAKISGHLLLRDSHDPSISSAPPVLKAGHWSVEKCVKVAEAEIKFQNTIGHTQHSTAGLGTHKKDPIPNKVSHPYRHLVSSTALSIDEEKSLAEAVQLHVQGQ